MPDIATIGAALSSLKTATDIVKFLRETDVTLEKAELKMKLADLMGSLADTKIELIEVQETLAGKDKKISELEDAFKNKDSVVRQYDAYYKSDANGKPFGVPYCLRCWESNHIQRQLVYSIKEHRFRMCTACGHQYEGRRAFEIEPQNNEQLAKE